VRCHHGISSSVAVVVAVSVTAPVEDPEVVASFMPLADVKRSANVDMAEILAISVKLGSFVSFAQPNSAVSRS
jgi:hypothetical protein